MCLNVVIISYAIHSNSLEKEMASLYGTRQFAEFTKARHWITSQDTTTHATLRSLQLGHCILV